jgi:hypothetical protein
MDIKGRALGWLESAFTEFVHDVPGRALSELATIPADIRSIGERRHRAGLGILVNSDDDQEPSPADTQQRIRQVGQPARLLVIGWDQIKAVVLG